MPVDIRHTIDRRVVERLFVEGSRVYLDMVRRGILVQNRARQLAPVDTGRLRSSIHVDSPAVRGRRVGVRVGTNVEYALHMEFGTRSGYTITPQRARVLRFRSGGRTVFTRRVVHPGVRARPFLRPALRAAGAG